MKVFLKLIMAIAFVGVALFVTTDKTEAATGVTKRLAMINVDGVKEIHYVAIKNERIYIPLRAVSERFPGTTVNYREDIKEVNVTLNGTYRERSEYYIDPLAKQTPYIRQINLDRNTERSKPYLRKFGSYLPLVDNNITYLAIRDIAELYGAQIEWDGTNNQVNILYKGKNRNGSIVYKDSAAFVNEVNQVHNDYVWALNYYQKLGLIFDVAEKLSFGGYKKSFKVMGYVAGEGATPYKNQFNLLLNAYNNKQYPNGVKMTKNSLGLYNSVSAQTLADIR